MVPWSMWHSELDFDRAGKDGGGGFAPSRGIYMRYTCIRMETSLQHQGALSPWDCHGTAATADAPNGAEVACAGSGSIGAGTAPTPLLVLGLGPCAVMLPPRYDMHQTKRKIRTAPVVLGILLQTAYRHCTHELPVASASQAHTRTTSELHLQAAACSRRLCQHYCYVRVLAAVVRPLVLKVVLQDAHHLAAAVTRRVI